MRVAVDVDQLLFSFFEEWLNLSPYREGGEGRRGVERVKVWGGVGAYYHCCL